MSASPLRRTFAVMGMLALIPILALMATGAITPMDAAIRALSVWLAVVVLGRIARAFLAGALRRVERRAGDPEPDAAQPAAPSGVDRRADDRGRRATDAVVEEADLSVS
ncbi:MAG TPA: hypothetical protein VK906_02170 [Egicoccus sp.]|nr:hypothetical protein [Egicoccus sp.]HSK21949.1 hypothetical protein [Egicoccus sp.]